MSHHQNNLNQNNQNNQNHSNHLRHWLAALFLPEIGPRSFMRLYEHFIHIEKIFKAPKTELQAIGLNERQIESILNPNWRSVDEALAWMKQSQDHHITTFADKTYPPLLKEISDPPLLLFVKGDLAALHTQQIAMVGARAATPFGIQNAEHFAYALIKAGMAVTSGLALGIDSAAHQGALRASGKTIAVLGAGLNHIYPRSNTKLAQQIIANAGALVSEFPLNVRPLAANFPRRNRVIAGICIGVIVIEAAVKSGSLITARHAVENGRDVFAIPGSIHHPLSRGCHYLIKQGAKLVEQASDVLEELGHHQPTEMTSNHVSENPVVLDANERLVLTNVGYEITSIDMILLQTGLTTSTVSSILLNLELRGLVQIVPGGCVRTLAKSI